MIKVLLAVSLSFAFADQEGTELSWSGLSFAVGDKEILRECTGRAAPGRVLAIMGPSGSGKTTLLNALAGNVKASKRAKLAGLLLCDGKECGGAAQVSGLRLAYVQQEDIFYTQMTVRETLMFAARLRLPSDVSLAEKERRVEELIDVLGLKRAADTVIGNVRRRGISGGERKRLSIGCELLSDPTLLFLDEPTSGLDSFAAQQVVNLLKRLAAQGTTVVTSIHQPRGSIFNLFDDLILVAQGHVVYNGPASAAASHFKSLGYPCPNNINAGEHVVDVVSRGYGTDDHVEGYDERLLQFEASASSAFASRARGASTRAKPPVPDAPSSALANSKGRGGARAGTQFVLLFKRAWREVARSKAAVAIKVAQQVMVALVYGGIYSLGNTQSSIQDRFGLLSLVAIGAGNLAIASTIRTFPKEKAIVSSERAKKMYGVPAYFAAKVVAEAPISAAVSALGGACLYPLVNLQPGASKFGKFVMTLVLEGFASGALGLLLGAVAPSTDTALAMFPPILVLMIVFNGFNLAEENAPKALRWIPKVSFIRWASEGLAVNEFTGLKFTCANSRGPCAQTGEEALERVSFHKSTVKHAALAQTRIIGAAYGATLFTLQRNKPKFLSVTPPTPKGI